MGSGEAFARGTAVGARESSVDVGGGEANPRGLQNLIKGGGCVSADEGRARVAGRRAMFAKVVGNSWRPCHRPSHTEARNPALQSHEAGTNVGASRWRRPSVKW